VVGVDCASGKSRPEQASFKPANFEEVRLLPEPISPELVLVDPELARRERARLEEKAYLQEVLDIGALRRALEVEQPSVEEIDQPRHWRRDFAIAARLRLVPAALLCSLLANGWFVARLVAHHGEEATQVAVRVVTLPASSTESRLSRNAAGPTSGRTSEPTTTISRALTAKGAVERKVVSLILAAPARKLPRDFIDPTTGLVRNNVQVVCRKARARSFMCAVRLASRTTQRPLYVRYRMHNGRGLFTWYGRGAKITS
jgi:hypothetical protein